MRDLFGLSYDASVDALRAPVRGVRMLLLGLVGMIVLMWFCNINHFEGLNLFFGISGFVMFIMLAIRPSFIVQSGLLGGVFAFLQDRDKTQGIATGPYWLYRLTLLVSFGYVFAAFTLTTWDFSAKPGNFWLILMGVITLALMEQVFRKKSDWGRIVMTFYVIGMIILAGWQTFGDAYNGRSFDPRTGESQFMIDPTTGNIDALGRTPAECRGTAEVGGFDYATNGTCFSAETGLRLVPMASQDALKRNPTSWLGTMSEMAETIPVPSGLHWWVLPILGLAAVGMAFRNTRKPALIVAGVIGVLFLLSSEENNLLGNNSLRECGNQSDQTTIRDGGPVRITLCSERMKHEHVVRLLRESPRDVEIEFSPETLILYGEMLAGRQAEDFVNVEPSPGTAQMGSAFPVLFRPRNDVLKETGMEFAVMHYLVKFKEPGTPSD